MVKTFENIVNFAPSNFQKRAKRLLYIISSMQDIRNIAIIAHVDHGKTTLVDRMIYQSRQAREAEKLGELILDNNDLERERGITILAKNVSVTYKDVKINIIEGIAISEERWKGFSTWPTECSCLWMPSKAACRRPVLCSRKP